ncbi:hypothetical protein K8B83_03555 [Shewanella inventionis]|uniref:Uncharacterized protein n=1 Tax=Shewanella inventionis TaxID=1738770 RepID=A0ABQ1JXC3_9GAMM|nr:hypothetical protein [Shewanella inventionis]MCL1160062.1 hypothetical protein [Shewanella inventionis]UAL45473.1 hypothetical protein K8B83_03555 [Shewanella inventionis]GGB76955.1 hypothetical protein GCM10011607_41480 [Shewanella inventionis]
MTNQKPIGNRFFDFYENREIMTWIITKYLITAAIIVAASEIAKRSDKFGALVVAL